MSIKEIVSILRSGGPIAASDLLPKTKASRKTVYRALDTLKEAGIVVEKGGLYYFFQDADVRVYETRSDYELALKHSEKLVPGLEYLMLSSTGKEHGEKERSGESVVMHLKTGYPEIYKLSEKVDSVRTSIKTEKRDFRQKFEEKLRKEFSSGLLYPEYSFIIVYEDIMNVVRGSERVFLDNFQVENHRVTCGGYTLAKEHLAETLKKFLEDQEVATTNMDHCRKIAELQNGYFEAKSEFDKQAELLKHQVENGTPLQGRCSICPNVKIRSSVEQERTD
jgi:DNA-binding Lrp family transcriptional regulator